MTRHSLFPHCLLGYAKRWEPVVTQRDAALSKDQRPRALFTLNGTFPLIALASGTFQSSPLRNGI